MHRLITIQLPVLSVTCQKIYQNVNHCFPKVIANVCKCLPLMKHKDFKSAFIEDCSNLRILYLLLRC